jgi:hypothetical protein
MIQTHKHNIMNNKNIYKYIDVYSLIFNVITMSNNLSAVYQYISIKIDNTIL